MRCRISVHIIRVTKRRAGFLQSRKCVFLWSATVAATEDAVSVRLRSIRGGLFRRSSHESILAEAEKIVWEPDFKGYIHDVGGPTANFRCACM